MIQPLRTAHRRIFAAMAVLMSLLIVAGVASRHPKEPERGQIVVLVGSRSSRGLMITQRSGTELVAISTRQVEFPDLVAYWAEAPKASAPDAHSVLLGQFVPGKLNRFTLPEASNPGTLILYSTPIAQVIDTAEIGGTQ